MTASLKIYNENFSMRFLQKPREIREITEILRYFFNEITKRFFSVSQKITPQLSEQILIH